MLNKFSVFVIISSVKWVLHMNKKYNKGKIVTGQVTGIEKYGIFISLDEFYSGLIHISEISDGFVKNINDYVKVGETIRAVVVDTDEYNYHVKLSIKNINYKTRRRNFEQLVETKQGFKPLGDKLDEWIDVELKKIKK